MVHFWPYKSSFQSIMKSIRPKGDVRDNVTLVHSQKSSTVSALP